jgi:hypothetical protein
VQAAQPQLARPVWVSGFTSGIGLSSFCYLELVSD